MFFELHFLKFNDNLIHLIFCNKLRALYIRNIFQLMSIKLIECPRDAMQGLSYQIPTQVKVNYINSLLKVGFDVLDCGSFVSPKAVPQLADTSEVLNLIDVQNSNTKLLVIVANEIGAENATKFKNIDFLGFPFSISETFQLRNTNKTIQQSLKSLIQINKIANAHHKESVVYLSMGFGNPYHEKWSEDIVYDWVSRLSDNGFKIISLSDTIGIANDHQISKIFNKLNKEFSHLELGVHLHTRPDNYLQNIKAAFESGCNRYDSAMKGYGGCPFAADKLTGNLPTESLIQFLKSQNVKLKISDTNFNKAFALADSVFNHSSVE